LVRWLVTIFFALDEVFLVNFLGAVFLTVFFLVNFLGAGFFNSFLFS